MATIAGLILDPLDTLFFRDGRPFGEGVRASSGLPMPQTFAGALRTWLLEQCGVSPKEIGENIRSGGGKVAFPEAVEGTPAAVLGRAVFRGPWFARKHQGNANGYELLLPVPAVLYRHKEDTDRLVRLSPYQGTVPGWAPPAEGIIPLWPDTNADIEPCGGFLTSDGMNCFLRGEIPKAGHLVPFDEIGVWEDRVGIGVNSETLTAADGQIYATRMLRLGKNVVLYGEIETDGELTGKLPKGENCAPLPLGGEGRRVMMKQSAAPLLNALKQSTGPKAVVTIISPGFIPGKATAWTVPGSGTRAAAVPGYLPVSGWDLARGGPKPCRFALPAGSTWFVENTDSKVDSICSGEDAALGWGTCVRGVWKDD